MSVKRVMLFAPVVVKYVEEIRNELLPFQVISHRPLFANCLKTGASSLGKIV